MHNLDSAKAIQPDIKPNNMTQQETSTAYGALGDLTVTLTTEINGEAKGDAKVHVEGGTICWVQGDQGEEFIKEVNEAFKAFNDTLLKITSKYRI